LKAAAVSGRWPSFGGSAGASPYQVASPYRPARSAGPSIDRPFTCHGFGLLPISLLALLAFGAVQLQAQTPIYSLPFFILFPAKYRLAKNLTYEGKEGSAIMILSSNVDLDLNGCALQEAAADNQAIGVLIDHQQNVTIRNGKIQAFQQAIVFDDHMGRNTTNVSEYQRTTANANVSEHQRTSVGVH
jgi:hypothetical protein